MLDDRLRHAAAMCSTPYRSTPSSYSLGERLRCSWGQSIRQLGTIRPVVFSVTSISINCLPLIATSSIPPLLSS
jgi:hypothetical protein